MLRKVSLYTLILIISLTIGGLNNHNLHAVVHASSENNGTETEFEEIDAPIEMIIDGERFIKIDEDKNEQLQSLIDFAHKYHANVYGLPDTDIILIVKGEDILLSSSTGSVATTKEYADILLDFHKNHEDEQFIQDLQTVIETGADINKVNADLTGYMISFDGQWILVDYSF